MKNKSEIRKFWAAFWMRLAGIAPLRGLATRMAMVAVPPFYGCLPLSKLTKGGFISPTATISHKKLTLGHHCFIGDNVTIYEDKLGGEVTLGDAVHLHQGSLIQTGSGGSLYVGDQTHIQPNCQFSAYQGNIIIGRNVDIAPACAFYPYNHGIAPDLPVRKQPLISKKGITVGDDAWLGYGVILLDGAQIGEGAVVGAGSVVTGEVPAGMIAAGVPARLIKHRSDASTIPQLRDGFK